MYIDYLFKISQKKDWDFVCLCRSMHIHDRGRFIQSMLNMISDCTFAIINNQLFNFLFLITNIMNRKTAWS